VGKERQDGSTALARRQLRDMAENDGRIDRALTGCHGLHVRQDKYRRVLSMIARSSFSDSCRLAKIPRRPPIFRHAP